MRPLFALCSRLPRGSARFGQAARAGLLVALLGIGQFGCATLGKGFHGRDRKDPVTTARKAIAVVPVRVGVIVVVNEDDHFVLIDTGNAPAPAPGVALKSLTEGVESGALKVGTVSRYPFVVADITGGTPRKGDVVYQ